MNHTLDSRGYIWQYQVSCHFGAVLCPLGTISSVLTIFSLFNRARTEKCVFFILMIIIALLDFVFVSAFLYVRCSELTYLRAFLKGFVFSISLASDLCVLALTAGRYLALCWPCTMQNLGPDTTRMVRAVGVGTICLISLTRMHYVVEELNGLSPLPRQFKAVWRPIAATLAIFGEMILPFVLMGSIVFFSGKIIHVVLKRKGAHKKHSQQSNCNKPDDGGSSVVSLVLVLDCFFILNQLGYCVLAVTEVLKALNEHDEEVLELYVTAAMAGDVLECCARCLHFYFYLKFSSLMRQEFLDAVHKTRAWLTRKER